MLLATTINLLVFRSPSAIVSVMWLIRAKIFINDTLHFVGENFIQLRIFVPRSMLQQRSFYLLSMERNFVRNLHVSIVVYFVD